MKKVCEKCGAELSESTRECSECGFLNKIRFIDKTPIEQVKTVLTWIGLGIEGIVVCWGLGFVVASASSHPGLDVPWWVNILFGIPIVLLYLFVEGGQKARALEKHNTIAEAAGMVCGYFFLILLIIVSLQREIMLALVIGDLLIAGFFAILFLPIIKMPYLERYYVLNGKKAFFVRWTANFLLFSIPSLSGTLLVDFL